MASTLSMIIIIVLIIVTFTCAAPVYYYDSGSVYQNSINNYPSYTNPINYNYNRYSAISGNSPGSSSWDNSIVSHILF
uniref:Uncharacterized protein n=1 Tax=Panagrolaimus sp. PS1159 TaxID=55785 RepID=A0AC35G4Q3_9BILA